MTPKHGLLLFITSCLSGCGQMYQGYMKRGLSLLLLFFVILAVSAFSGTGGAGLLPAGGVAVRVFRQLQSPYADRRRDTACG